MNITLSPSWLDRAERLGRHAGLPVDAMKRRFEQDLWPRIQKKLFEKGIPLARRSGFRVDELSHGLVRCTMPFRKNGNHIGSMYAGALFTLGELPGGGLFLASFDTKHFFPIVKEMNIRFLKPATTDISIEIRMDDARIQALQDEAEAKGKAEFVLEGELKNTSGEVVALSRGVYQIRRRST